jgi:hypothetical protein
MKTMLVFICAIPLLFGMAGTASALLLNESIDAGAMPELAADVGNLTQWDGIVGSLSAYDVDLWRFDIFFTGQFTAQTNVPYYDPQLFLFDASGNGIIGNNDIGGDPPSYNTNAFIHTILDPGTYYLGISRNDLDPIDATGHDLFDDVWPGLQNPWDIAGPLAGWSGTVDAGNFGTPNAYKIYTQVLPTPEPVTLLLFGAGLACMAGFGRKSLLNRS